MFLQSVSDPIHYIKLHIFPLIATLHPNNCKPYIHHIIRQLQWTRGFRAHSWFKHSAEEDPETHTDRTVLGGGGQEDLEPELPAATCCQQPCTVDLDPELVSLSPQTGRARGAGFSTIQDFLTPSGSCLLLSSREACGAPLYSLTIGVMHGLYGLFWRSSIQIFHGNNYRSTNGCQGSTEFTVQTRNLRFLMKKCEC